MKKLLICLTVFFSLFATNLFSQETEAKPSESEENTSLTEELPAAKKSFLERTDFILELSPGFYISGASNNKAGEFSSPIYPFCVGFIWPNDYFIGIEPTISFFVMYHLWYDGTAYPAEPENRTSQTFDILINVPVSISFFMKTGVIQITPGLGFLARFGVLASGVSESDSGYSGNAGSDMKEINQWFWQNGRFLYLTFGTSYQFNLTEKLRGGPTIHAYLPIGTIFSGESVEGLMISIGMKLII